MTELSDRGVLRHAARAAVLALVVTGTVAFAQDGLRADADAAPQTVLEAVTASASAGDPLERSGEVASRSGRAALATVELDDGVHEVAAEGTVADALVALGVVLDADSVVSAELDATLTAGMAVSVRTAQSATVTVEEEIPFATSEIEDATLAEGRRVVQTAGVSGHAVTTYLVRSVDGVEIDRTELAQVESVAVRDEVVLVGTMTLPDASASVLSPDEARAVARAMVADRGWGEDQFQCLDNLWTKESNWRVQAKNSSSGAYGIPQSLPGSKMASVAADWETNAATQITWGLNYIAGRYSTPCGAWSASQSKGWY
ncbi:MAG: G5 domain-containing protein [Cellulomonadaceae bacterium]